MTGFNMPPGCNPSDIPGGDVEAAEAEVENIYEMICTHLGDPTEGEEEKKYANLAGEFFKHLCGCMAGAADDARREERYLADLEAKDDAARRE